MSIPNEALQKLIQEIESRALLAQQQITIVESQIAAKQRDIRMLQLTAGELDTVPQDTRVYEGVGKMFVFSPIDEVQIRLSSEISEMKSDIVNLDKKLHYLETTRKNSRDHIEQIFKRGEKS